MHPHSSDFSSKLSSEDDSQEGAFGAMPRVSSFVL